MGTILIYQCPVDHHGPNDWAAWNEKVTSCLRGYHQDQFGFYPPFKIISNNKPLFYYGRKRASSIDDLKNETTVQSDVVEIRHWSTIVFYSAVAIIVGEGVEIEEVKRCLRHLILLNEYPNGFALEQVKLALYGNAPEQLLTWLKNKRYNSELVYVTNRPYEGFDWNWLTPENWAVLRESSDNIVVVQPKPGCPIELIWRYHMDHAFTAVGQSSILIDTIIAGFDDCDDMALFLGKLKVKEPIITFNRNHVDDCYFCAYNLPLFDEIHFPMAVF